jgi:hypothetical protein
MSFFDVEKERIKGRIAYVAGEFTLSSFHRYSVYTTTFLSFSAACPEKWSVAAVSSSIIIFVGEYRARNGRCVPRLHIIQHTKRFSYRTIKREKKLLAERFTI